MRTAVGEMDGEEWERYCQRILRLRYPRDYQQVPDKFGGDLGIEGFTFSGLVFQCYCPDGNPEGRELYNNQRDKISRDIAKLTRNSSRIAELGVPVVKEWHFLTPRYENRELLVHCRRKEAEICSSGCAIIAPTFRILLQTEDDYLEERQHILGNDSYLVQPVTASIDSGQIQTLADSTNPIVTTIRRKLAKLHVAEAAKAELTRNLITGYAVGQDELVALYNRFPAIHADVLKLKDAAQVQLSLRTIGANPANGSTLRQALEHYEADLSTSFAGSLSASLIKRLSTEAISDWLGRCPLDFNS